MWKKIRDTVGFRCSSIMALPGSPYHGPLSSVPCVSHFYPQPDFACGRNMAAEIPGLASAHLRYIYISQRVLNFSLLDQLDRKWNYIGESDRKWDSRYTLCKIRGHCLTPLLKLSKVPHIWNKTQNLHHGLSDSTECGLLPQTHVPLAHSASAILAILLFLKLSKQFPKSSPLHLLVPYPEHSFLRSSHPFLIHFIQVSVKTSPLSHSIYYKITPFHSLPYTLSIPTWHCVYSTRTGASGGELSALLITACVSYLQ